MSDTAWPYLAIAALRSLRDNHGRELLTGEEETAEQITAKLERWVLERAFRTEIKPIVKIGQPSQAAIEAGGMIADLVKENRAFEWGVNPDRTTWGIDMAVIIDRALEPERKAAEEMAYALAEWHKGCTCCDPGKPWECSDCSAAFHRVTARKVMVYRAARGER